MREITQQFFSIWKNMRPLHKGAVLCIVLFVAGLLGSLVFMTSSPRFIPLYPPDHLTANDLVEIRQHLEKSGVAFEEKKESGFLVPEKEAHRLRIEFGTLGIPRHDQSKGFELFDSNTWIKGEKELQVLEMRALKGQLEKDIAKYDNIKSAHVILDIPPARSFGGGHYKTKASVILSLVPGTRLSASQLKAITHHLAGAVRGLEPHMIAISDTSGKLYQAINPEGKQGVIEDPQALFEEHVYEKMAGLLTKMAGPDYFYLTVEGRVDLKSGIAESLSAVVLLECSLVQESHPELLWKEEIERQFHVILSGYPVQGQLSIHFVPLIKNPAEKLEKKGKSHYVGMWLTVAIVFVALVSAVPLFKKKTRSKKEEDLFQFATKVNIDRLTQSIEGENPETIAFLLTKLAPLKAKEILLALPAAVQEKVLSHLAALEEKEQ